MPYLNSLNKNEICLCGKEKFQLNDINWKRHISSCKIDLKFKNSEPTKYLTVYFSKKKTRKVNFFLYFL